jgi:hypothetical protein
MGPFWVDTCWDWLGKEDNLFMHTFLSFAHLFKDEVK